MKSIVLSRSQMKELISTMVPMPIMKFFRLRPYRSAFSSSGNFRLCSAITETKINKKVLNGCTILLVNASLSRFFHTRLSNLNNKPATTLEIIFFNMKKRMITPNTIR